LYETILLYITLHLSTDRQYIHVHAYSAYEHIHVHTNSAFLSKLKRIEEGPEHSITAPYMLQQRQ